MIKEPSTMVRFRTAFLAIISVFITAYSLESVDLENEINRLKKELSQVRIERQKAIEDMSKDKNEFADYEKRTASRKTECALETDSIQRETGQLTQKKDSLAAIIGFSQLKRKQYELLQESLRQSILSACSRLMELTKKTPLGTSSQTLGALTFLMNDCKTKSIDNNEGLRRLMQIIQNLDEAGSIIQIGQETAAVPEIRGSALMLRIGNVFEAIVDDDAKVCALWRGVDSLERPKWEVTRDPAVCALILKAISVRQAKDLPSFINLPWGVAAKTEVPQ